MYTIDLSGRTAVVTGAGRGIGRALAIGFAKAGARLVVASRTRVELEELASKVRGMGGQALVCAVDITCQDQVDHMLHAALEEYGRIDVLVNNVGIAIPQPATEVTEDAWDKVVNTNLKATFFVSQAVGRAMIAQGQGVIINIVSELAFVALAGYSCYSATKAGIVMLTKSLALEWAPYGIRVNAIAPAAIETKANTVLATGEDRRAALARLPIGRCGTVDDLVGAAVYLASEASSYVLGTTLMVDGGRVII